MADIFISYARKDLRWASNLAQALNSYGWSVWWDPNIPAGEEFDEIIDKELSRARCLIVGWTGNSIRSRYVKDEAREADEQGKLIPVLLEKVKPPYGFRSIQHVDLIDWDGTVNSERLGTLVEQLEKTLGPAPNPDVPEEEYQRTQEFFGRLLDYDTGLVSTIVRVIRKDNDLVGGDVFGLNVRATRLYGLAHDPHGVSKIQSSDLMNRIADWVNADDFKAFLEDQQRLVSELILGAGMSSIRPFEI